MDSTMRYGMPRLNESGTLLEVKKISHYIDLQLVACAYCGAEPAGPASNNLVFTRQIGL